MIKSHRKNPLVSIILPMYNEEKRIDRALNSLLNQTYPNAEIIVVDDGSIDNTEKIVKEYPVKLIKIEHSGKSYAKNMGAKMASGDILVFVEADGVYPPKYIESIIPHFVKDPKVGGVSTPYRILNTINFITLCKDVERQVNFSDNYKPFGVSIYRKSVFEEIGGFDENLEFGEDIDPFPRLIALGYKAVFEPRALWFHEEESSLASLLIDRFKKGKGITAYNLKHRLSLIPLRSFILFILTFLSSLLGVFNHQFFIATLILLIYSFLGVLDFKE